MLGEITHLQAIVDDLTVLTEDPHKLPPASEQVTVLHCSYFLIMQLTLFMSYVVTNAQLVFITVMFVVVIKTRKSQTHSTKRLYNFSDILSFYSPPSC